MSKGCVFISYRRDDSAGYARAIYNQLAQFFSAERIFMDVDSIEPGLEFDKAINLAVGRCDILLAIIGKHWMDKQEENKLRINDPNDFVRLEISTALSRNIRVIPVLLDGTTMPEEEELPESLRLLARRQAFEINSSRFNSDLDRLIKLICKTLGETRKQYKSVSGRYFWMLSGLSFGVLVGILISAHNFHSWRFLDFVATILFAALNGVIIGYRAYAAFRGHADNDYSNDNSKSNDIGGVINNDDNLYIANALSDNDINFDFDGISSCDGDSHEVGDIS